MLPLPHKLLYYMGYSSRLNLPVALSLRHLPLRKRSTDPDVSGFFRCFRGFMREVLSTGPCAGMPESGLSGPIFSGPHDCADLVNSLQASEAVGLFRVNG